MSVSNHIGEGPPYFRLVFTAYWNDVAPSSEVFYCKRHGIFFTYKGIAALEEYVFQQLQAHAPDSELLRVIYVGGIPIEFDSDDVTDLGWRALPMDNR